MKVDNVICEFAVGSPKFENNNDAIWMVVDPLKKTTHFFSSTNDNECGSIGEVAYRQHYEVAW